MVKSMCCAPADADIISPGSEDEDALAAVALLTVKRGKFCTKKIKFQLTFFTSRKIHDYFPQPHAVRLKVNHLQWTAITPNMMPAIKDMAMVKMLKQKNYMTLNCYMNLK